MKIFEGVQKNILDSSMDNQLVSAGAGSGKTTVMIEKIYNLIMHENVPISSLVVVTFTVLASVEMKSRLISKMQEALEQADNKAEIQDKIDELKTASIDTIDGFSSKMVKKYFYELQINPNIEIINDTTRDYFLTKAMKKTMDSAMLEFDKINALIDVFGGNRRDTKSIENLLLKNYYNVINIEDYQEFLNHSIDEYSVSLKSEKVVLDYILNAINSLRSCIIENSADVKGAQKEAVFALLEAVEDFNPKLSFKTNLRVLNALNLPTLNLRGKDVTQGMKDIAQAIKKVFALREELSENNINENYEFYSNEIVTYFKYFVDLLKAFIKNYDDIKAKNNLIDFNDLNRLMLKLLSIDKVKKEIQGTYKYIFVDEYQDVNPLQDKLLNMLRSKDTKMFMVGDGVCCERNTKKNFKWCSL